MTVTPVPEPSTTTTGLLIHTPIRYDLRAWWHARGRADEFRAEEVRLAGVRPGDRVLDVGCGTGSLTMAAARAAGPTGRVVGIDPSLEMVRWARTKARLLRRHVEFVATAGEALPFPADAFDVVTMSLVLHQLPSDALHGTMGQVRRVLAPGGRLLLVELDLSAPTGNTVHARRHGAAGHGDQRFDLDRVGLLVEHIGLEIVERGPITFRFRGLEPLRYLLATAPAA